MPDFKVTVRGMTATYSGKVTAENADQAVGQTRAAYLRKGDSRAYWHITARPWLPGDDEKLRRQTDILFEEGDSDE